jgi:hypothetical protein
VRALAMDERRRSRGGGEIDGEARKRKRVAGSWAGVGPAEIDVDGERIRARGCASVRAWRLERKGRGSARVVRKSDGACRSGRPFGRGVLKGRATGRVGAGRCGKKFNPMTWLNVRPEKWGHLLRKRR